MAKLVAKRYAEALYEVGVESDTLEQFKEEMMQVSDVLQREPKLKTIFEHPKLSKNEKKEIINSIFGGRFKQEVLNFIYIIIDKGREKFIKDIYKEYSRLTNEKQGIIEAEAITAVEMTDDDLDRLQKKLSKKFKKSVILKNKIDKDVIGGVLVKIEDRIIDSTIKGQLDMLKDDLINKYENK